MLGNFDSNYFFKCRNFYCGAIAGKVELASSFDFRKLAWWVNSAKQGDKQKKAGFEIGKVSFNLLLL